MMPEMDGFEFMDELRRHPEWRDIPVLIITAKDLTDEDHRRLNGGVIRIITKSGVETEVVLQEITTALNQGVKRKQEAERVQ